MFLWRSTRITCSLDIKYLPILTSFTSVSVKGSLKTVKNENLLLTDFKKEEVTYSIRHVFFFCLFADYVVTHAPSMIPFLLYEASSQNSSVCDKLQKIRRTMGNFPRLKKKFFFIMCCIKECILMSSPRASKITISFGRRVFQMLVKNHGKLETYYSHKLSPAEVIPKSLIINCKDTYHDYFYHKKFQEVSEKLENNENRFSYMYSNYSWTMLVKTHGRPWNLVFVIFCRYYCYQRFVVWEEECLVHFHYNS